MVYVQISTSWLHGRPQDFFSRGGKRRVWRTKSPSEVQGQAPVELVWGWRHFLDIMQKYFVYWDFRQHLQLKKNTSQHFQGTGASPPLAHAWERPCMTVNTAAHQCSDKQNAYSDIDNLASFKQNCTNTIHLLELFCDCYTDNRACRKIEIEQGLTSHQTHYRSYRGRFLQVIWPNQQCQSTKGKLDNRLVNRHSFVCGAEASFRSDSVNGRHH